MNWKFSTPDAVAVYSTNFTFLASGKTTPNRSEISETRFNLIKTNLAIIQQSKVTDSF
jgi:hypothetical protein